MKKIVRKPTRQIKPVPKHVWYHEKTDGMEVGVRNRSILGLIIPFMVLCLVAGFFLNVFGEAPYSFLEFFPIILTGIAFIPFSVYHLLGKLEFNISGDKLTVFRGVGSIGIHNHFNLDTVKGIRICKRAGTRGPRVPMGRVEEEYLEITGEKYMKLGKMIDSDQLKYIYQKLGRFIHDHRSGFRDILA